MNKLCCCTDNELPDVSVNVTCACCESRVQERKTKDSPDLDMTENDVNEQDKKLEVENEENEYKTCCCCCFRRKRHAKKKKKKNISHHGSKT